MKKLLLLLVAVLCTQVLFAQLKVGDNPTVINKSSILELESRYQGLLLTRITDTTTTINPLGPPDGMIIYYTDSVSAAQPQGPNAGLYVRVHGGWQLLSAAGALADSAWTLRGNALTDSTKNFLGTTDNNPLLFKTANSTRLKIESNGQLIAEPGTIQNGSNELQVLVIDGAGDIHQRTVPSSIFDNAIVSLNNLRDTVQAFAIDSSGTAANFNITSASTAGVGVHTFHLPFQTGTGAVNWGLLSYTDWIRFDSAAKAKLLYSIFSEVPDARGVTINGDSIVLHAATAATPGGVSTDAQTFGGSKTFADSVTVGGTLGVTGNTTLGANLTVADSAHIEGNAKIDSTLILTTTPATAAAGQNSVLIRDNTTGKVVTRTIDSSAFKELVTGHDSTQRDIFIDSSNATQLKINIPYASTHVNGIVDTVSQSFAGNKLFADSVETSAALAVGSTANANSTLQLTGSLAMAITNVSAGAYTVSGTDNTVLANCTGGNITVTLPSTAGIAGRIITIKKVGTGGINNDLVINPIGGATIDGGLGYTIYNDWTFVTLQTDGTNWYIIKR